MVQVQSSVYMTHIELSRAGRIRTDPDGLDIGMLFEWEPSPGPRHWKGEFEGSTAAEGKEFRDPQQRRVVFEEGVAVADTDVAAYLSDGRRTVVRQPALSHTDEPRVAASRTGSRMEECPLLL